MRKHGCQKKIYDPQNPAGAGERHKKIPCRVAAGDLSEQQILFGQT
jgi:hypothetical protein